MALIAYRLVTDAQEPDSTALEVSADMFQQARDSHFHTVTTSNAMPKA